MKNNDFTRRDFIAQTTQAASLLTVAGLSSLSSLASTKTMTVQQIIDFILKEGKLLLLKETVDTLKSGSSDQVVSGIVTTMFPTITVIEEAAPSTPTLSLPTNLRFTIIWITPIGWKIIQWSKRSSNCWPSTVLPSGDFITTSTG